MKCPRCKVDHAGEMKTCDRCREQNKKYAAQRKVWASQNRDKMRASHNVWKAQHPDYWRNLRTPEYVARQAALNRAWRAANPEAARAIVRERHARRRAQTISPFTQAELRARLSMYAGCWICKDPAWEEIDHVKPLSKGGPHMLSNLRPVCKPCNRQKAARWPFILPGKVAA